MGVELQTTKPKQEPRKLHSCISAKADLQSVQNEFSLLHIFMHRHHSRHFPKIMTLNSTKNFAKSNCTVQQYPEIMLYHIHCHRTLKRGFGAECIVFGLLERTVVGKFAEKGN